MKRRFASVCGIVTLAALAPLGADPVKLDPASLRRVGQVDERFQSYNVEMVEVTGGRFWAPYRSQVDPREQAAEKLSVPGGGRPGREHRP